MPQNVAVELENVRFLEVEPEDLKFLKVEDFFEKYQTWDYVTRVISYFFDAGQNMLTLNTESKTGVKSALVILIPRQDTFRFRFNPGKTSADQYTLSNTRTVVMNTFNDLARTMNDFTVEMNTPGGDRLELLTKKGDRPFMKLQIDLNPYQMSVYHYNEDQTAVLINSDANPALYFRKIIFNGSSDVEYSVIQAKNKPGTAKYVGFGEKGGLNLCKNATQLNYFNYDNMRYMQVYSRGALDDREPLYHSNPFFLEFYGAPQEKSVYGIFIDNVSQVFMDMGYLNSERYLLGSRFNDLDYYFFAGNSCPEIIDAYTSIVGTAKLQPRFALGYHQGCYGYDNRQKLEEVADNYRRYQIPIDGLHIDVDIQKNYQTFTIDEGKFPNPKEMFTRLQEKGFKCSTNITPIISNRDPNYATYQSGLSGGYFVTDQRCPPLKYDGETYQDYSGGWESPHFFKDPNYNSGNPYVGEVYYGDDRGTTGHYPDLGRKEVRIWWGQQYQYLFEMGLQMVWQDMTTPCIRDYRGDMRSFPFKLLVTNDFVKAFEPDEMTPHVTPKPYPTTPFIKMVNLYSYNLHKATYQGLNNLAIPERKNKRNFIIGRGCFSGMHRYAALWTGDNSSNWHFLQINIPQMLALGLSGQPIAGSDIGGFERDEDWQKWADPELLIRWIAMGAFLPWFRNHYIAKGVKAFQEPYNYTQQWVLDQVPWEKREMYYCVLPVCKHYIELRYRLMQLFYDAMFENTITGMPICRALFLNHGTDAALFNDKLKFLSNQFMVGNDLLIAPVVEPQSSANANGKRDVYLPTGTRWYCFMDNKLPLAQAMEGGSTIHDFDAGIYNNPNHYGFIVPLYVRAGAIIPTLEQEQYVGERNANGQPNPITLNIYPGAAGEYIMYLDDGVSRSSAPSGKREEGYDEMARDEYRKTRITHRYSAPHTREIKVTRLHDNYTPTLEPYFFVAVLHDPQETYGDHGPLANITAAGAGLPLITGGSPGERAGKLLESAQNAWYYNEDIHISFLKIFDNSPDIPIQVEYLQT